MLSAELSILVPAFLAGLLVLATHVPLGRLVLERGIVFIDLAIAQVAGLGVIAAHSVGFGAEGWITQVAAEPAAAALPTAAPAGATPAWPQAAIAAHATAKARGR